MGLGHLQDKTVVIWMMICILPTFFVAVMVFLQTWQICINQTSNEMANYFRFDYFFPKPKNSNAEESLKEFDDGLGEGDAFKYRKFCNPFDMGIIRNLRQFWGLEKGIEWHKLYSVEEHHEKTIEMA